MRAEDSDERDSSWEGLRPRYRVFIFHHSRTPLGEDDYGNYVETFDLSEADLADVTAFAEDKAHGEHLYAIGLVVDNDADYPGRRGIIWLSGYDYNARPQNDFEAHAIEVMLARVRSTPSH